MACRTSKDVLYAWLGPRRVQPKYVTKLQGQEPTSGFVSVLNIPEYGLRTTGLGGTKKEAEESAAKDFIEKLKRSGSWERGQSPRDCVADAAPRVAPDSPDWLTQWIKVRRPPGQDSKSYLNILSAKNHIKNPSYETYSSDGGFRSRLTFTLPSGSVIVEEATAPAKAKAETECATAAIAQLQAMHLACVDVAEAVQADTPPHSVSRCLSAPLAVSAPEPPQWPRNSTRSDSPSGLSNFLTALELTSRAITSSLEPVRGSASASPGSPVPATAGSSANVVVYNYGSQHIHLPSSPSIYLPGNMHSDASYATAYNYERPPSAVSRERTPAALGTRSLSTSKYTRLAVDGRVITDRVILHVGRQLGNLRKTVALDLGLTEADVENCAYDERDPYEINRRLLRKWLEQESSRATVGRLCQVLWDAEAYDALDALHSEMAHSPTL